MNYGTGASQCKVIQIAVVDYPNDVAFDGAPLDYPGPGHRLYALMEDGTIWYNDMRPEEDEGWYWRMVPAPKGTASARFDEEQAQDNLKNKWSSP